MTSDLGRADLTRSGPERISSEAPGVKRVVVLTHNSNIFLQAEIDALAWEFDEVVVLAWEDSGLELRLPLNARHLGSFSGFDENRSSHWRRVFSPRFLRPFVRVAWHELRRWRTLRDWRRFVWVCLLGAHIADLPGLREAVSSPGVDTTLYSFWASEPAYPVPWLPKVTGGWVVRHHSADLYEWASGYLPLWHWIAASADMNLFVSEDGLIYARSQLPQIATRSEVRLLGSRDAGREPSDEPVEPTVVSCSALVPGKRVPLLARALTMLDQPVRWVHLGSGEDEPRVRQTLAGSPGVTAELRGQLSHDQVLDFYRTTPVSVFVNVSDVEGLPVSICEALSFDIPVVAAAAGGNSEVIGREHGTGILIPVDTDAQGIAEAIAEVIRLGPGAFHAREVWQRRLDAQRNAEDLARWMASKTWLSGRKY